MNIILGVGNIFVLFLDEEGVFYIFESIVVVIGEELVDV